MPAHPRLGLWRLVAPVLLLAGCADDVPAGASDSTNAVAAYVALDADIATADDLTQALTRARPDEPSSPAGFVQGLRASIRVVATDGVIGTRLIFQANATEADRELLAAHSRELGLGEPTWLGPADRWPDCEAEPDCERVGQSNSLP